MKPLTEMTELELQELVDELKELAENRNIKHIFKAIVEEQILEAQKRISSYCSCQILLK